MRFAWRSLAYLLLSSSAATLAQAPVSCPTIASSPSSQALPTVADAQSWMDCAEAELLDLNTIANHAQWIQETYINFDSEMLAAKENERMIAATTQLIDESKRFDGLTLPPDLARKFKLLRLSLGLPAPHDPKLRAELTQVAASLDGSYGQGKYCPGGDQTKCMGQDGVEVLMEQSRDPEALKEAWTGWHQMGAPMKERYARMVELSNQGARELGYADTGVLWRSQYDESPEQFSADLERLWKQVQPLYLQLHAYVRRRLIQRYGAVAQRPDGMIPADLLGNMWAQEWGNINDIVAPASTPPAYNLSKILEERHTDAAQMVHYGESFFESLGFPPLPETFWERSMLTRPRDRDVVCHPSAWDIDNNLDVRLKVCLHPTAYDFTTVHHELGHNYYQMAYRNQPYLFQNGANDGFHEAIGDTIALSITPEYLKEIGLIQEVPPASADIPLLLHTALDKIAFLPFGLLIDKWRWQVFSGNVTPAEYETEWWRLREEYQGVAPPVDRSEADFDPGAKAHIPGNVPYVRYFLARIYQFQFYRAMCRAAGYVGPLNRCSFYGSKAAGDKLNSMLELGQSKPWPEAMRIMTGEDHADASAMMEYFQPLLVWLQQQNRGETLGWKVANDPLKAH